MEVFWLHWYISHSGGSLPLPIIMRIMLISCTILSFHLYFKDVFSMLWHSKCILVHCTFMCFYGNLWMSFTWNILLWPTWHRHSSPPTLREWRDSWKLISQKQKQNKENPPFSSRLTFLTPRKMQILGRNSPNNV